MLLSLWPLLFPAASPTLSFKGKTKPNAPPVLSYLYIPQEFRIIPFWWSKIQSLRSSTRLYGEFKAKGSRDLFMVTSCKSVHGHKLQASIPYVLILVCSATQILTGSQTYIWFNGLWSRVTPFFHNSLWNDYHELAFLMNMLELLRLHIYFLSFAKSPL